MKTLGFVSQLNGQNVVMTLSVIWHICMCLQFIYQIRDIIGSSCLKCFCTLMMSSWLRKHCLN